MAKNSKAKTNGNKTVAEGSESPRSAKLAANGIRTANEFAAVMSALMCDLLEGRVPPSVGNASCNAGGKLLKVTEMQIKYGTNGPGTGRRTLELTIEEDREPALLPSTV